jgi:hypothetical protein
MKLPVTLNVNDILLRTELHDNFHAENFKTLPLKGFIK